MTLPVPKLDDRRFDALVRDALELVRTTCPEWTDLNAGDPGVTLIEVFAFLTENMIYRLNRVPEKVYVTLMNLVGAHVRPPSAAVVNLRFSRAGEDTGDIEIPVGTQVSTGDGTVTFVVTEATALKHGQAFVEAIALHCELIEAELVGSGPLQSARLRKPPVISPTADGQDIIVGLEADAHDLQGIPSRSVGGKAFAVWTPTENYADAINKDRSFIVDRASGLIVFPTGGDAIRPGAMKGNAGREVRAWYRRGGGRAGNVGRGLLAVLKTPGLKLAVTNPEPAAGGVDGETIQEAINRTPIEAASMQAAITARDFERAASTVGGIARARAFALAQQWRHADAGVVQILVVPSVNADLLPENAITTEVIQANRSEDLRKQVAKIIDLKRPLGVRTAVDWVKMWPVSVSAHVVVTRGEDTATKAKDIRKRLNAVFSPLNDRRSDRPLRASDAYEAILADPSVRYADSLRFKIGDAPDKDVENLARDPHQPQTWFAATQSALHRSLDDGESWSIIFGTPEDHPRFVCRHNDRPGLLALGVSKADGKSALHLSADCGETWSITAAAFDCEIWDATWIERDSKPLLLIATEQGVVQFQPNAGTGPRPIDIDKNLDAHGYYAVTALTLPSGAIAVAVAAQQTRGVYFSSAGGVSGTFKYIGRRDKDIRFLAFHRYNARDFLWAAAQSEAGQLGEGAYRLELGASGVEDDPPAWQDLTAGWQGGSCHALAFADGTVFAASDNRGVLTVDIQQDAPIWRTAGLDAGLPLRGTADRLLEPVSAVAAASASPKPIVFAGGPRGVYKSKSGGERFALASATEFAERIPVPPNCLYCAGPHNIVVEEEREG